MTTNKYTRIHSSLMAIIFLLIFLPTLAMSADDNKGKEKDEGDQHNWFGNIPAKFILDRVDNFIAKVGQRHPAEVLVGEGQKKAGQKKEWPVELEIVKFTDEDGKKLLGVKKTLLAYFQDPENKQWPFNEQIRKLMERNEEKIAHAEMMMGNQDDKMMKRTKSFDGEIKALHELRVEIDQFLKQLKFDVALTQSFGSLDREMGKNKGWLMESIDQFIADLHVEKVMNIRKLKGSPTKNICAEKRGKIENHLQTVDKIKYASLRSLYLLNNLSSEVFARMHRLIQHPFFVQTHGSEKIYLRDVKEFEKNAKTGEFENIIHLWVLAEHMSTIWMQLNSREAKEIMRKIHDKGEMPRVWYEELANGEERNPLAARVKMFAARVFLAYQHLSTFYGISKTFNYWQNVRGQNAAFDSIYYQPDLDKNGLRLALELDKMPTKLCEKIALFYS